MKPLKRLFGILAYGAALLVPAGLQAQSSDAVFDAVFGTKARIPQSLAPVYSSPLEKQIAEVADGAKGRIGVAAMDLDTGETISILGNQRFPMASTSKVAIAATFLEGVDQGKWTLDQQFPLMVPRRSVPLSTKVAPVSPGKLLSASVLLDMMLTHSNNEAADAILAVVGGPDAVNAWVRRAGITDFHLDRDIATLVRDDGQIDPAQQIDMRDSATPLAMVKLLKGLYEGRWLSKDSHDLLISIMDRCKTGKRRIVALMPDDVTVAHKTGSLNNTSSDIGIIRTDDGHSIAVAIYVTGQGSRLNREERIATIARAVFDGYVQPAKVLVTATY